MICKILESAVLRNLRMRLRIRSRMGMGMRIGRGRRRGKGKFGKRTHSPGGSGFPRSYDRGSGLPTSPFDFLAPCASEKPA